MPTDAELLGCRIATGVNAGVHNRWLFSEWGELLFNPVRMRTAGAGTATNIGLQGRVPRDVMSEIVSRARQERGRVLGV